MQVSVNSQNFRFWLPALHIQKLSNRCSCKYDPSISRFFKISFLAGFCNLPPLCVHSVKSDSERLRLKCCTLKSFEGTAIFDFNEQILAFFYINLVLPVLFLSADVL